MKRSRYTPTTTTVDTSAARLFFPFFLLFSSFLFLSRVYLLPFASEIVGRLATNREARTQKCAQGFFRFSIQTRSSTIGVSVLGGRIGRPKRRWKRTPRSKDNGPLPAPSRPRFQPPPQGGPSRTRVTSPIIAITANQRTGWLPGFNVSPRRIRITGS